MDKTAIALGLAMSLASHLAAAQAARLSNDQLAGFSVVIGSPHEEQNATAKIVPVAIAVLPPIPLLPSPAVPSSTRRPDTAAEPKVPAIAAASPVAPPASSDHASVGAGSAHKLLLHIRPSTELMISSGTIQDAGLSAVGDEVILHVDGAVISIKAQGISGISFEP